MAAGASTTFTCDHVLTAVDQAAGQYTNNATITGTPPPGSGSPITNQSNTVVVVVPASPAPSFTIVKEQMIAGVGSFTTSQLTGSVGQTVNYEILVTNTGNTSLTFSSFTDPHCDGGTISGGPGGNPVAASGSTTFTCSHVLTAADQAAGSYTNTATITGTPPGGPPTTTPSNPVVVNVPVAPAPSFSIVKEQQIVGAGSFTTATLTGSVGQTVLYEMLVTNTGNTSLTFGSLTDPHCDAGTITGGPGGNPVVAGASTTFFCDHVLTAADQAAGQYTNTATITGTPPPGSGSPITNQSNTVVVNVPPAPAPSFTIAKLQEIAGVGPFTMSQLTGAVGEAVDYEMIVTNTGNTALTFSALTDVKCDGGTLAGGPGGNPVAAGASTTFTCDHVLTAVDQTAGSYTNNATITGTPPAGSGSPITNQSNTVVVVVPASPAPSFTILKEQMIAGVGSFTTSQLTGAVGETVDYEILVTNTGNTSLTFTAFSDPHCDAGTISGGPGGNPVTAGSSTAFFCSHVLTAADQAAGSYTNTATITGTPPGGPPTTTPSNPVVVNVPVAPAPSFSIVKEQQIVGAGAFTTSTLTGAAGQTVLYEMLVTNTGNTSLTFGSLTDPHCDGGTITGGPGGSPVAAGASTTFFCDHVLTAADQAVGQYTNTATITGTPPAGAGSPITNQSNTVVVNLPATPSPSFTIVKEQQIAGSGSFTTAQLTGSVGQTVDYEMIVTNTGNTSLTFSAFTDTQCDSGTITGGPGGAPVAAGASTTYTCTHTLTAADQTAGSYPNNATVTGTPPAGSGSPTTNTSNTVVVTIPTTGLHGTPSITLVKTEQIDNAGAAPTPGAYTGHNTVPSGTPGQVVNYLITVTNTGTTTLDLSYADTLCSNLQGPTLVPGTGSLSTDLSNGEPQVTAGTQVIYTCQHTLAVADTDPYVNTASVVGTVPSTGATVNANDAVQASIVLAPSLTIVKSQRDVTSNTPSDGSYTAAALTANVGDTISYHITVTNTGQTPLALALNDPTCSPASIQGPFPVSGTLTGSTLSPGGVAYFSCSHVLASTDGSSFTNTATVTGTPPGGTPITTPPSSVVVTVTPTPPPNPTVTPSAPTPGLAVVKKQKLSTASTYTGSPVTASIGQTIDYEVVATNTGNETLSLTSFSDPKCDAGTVVDPTVTSIAPGQSATWKCTHKVRSGDSPALTNVAVVTVTPPTGSALSGHGSVVANVPKAAVKACVPTKSQAKLNTTTAHGTVNAVVTGKDIAKVTFYVDGHKVKTVAKSNSKNHGYAYSVAVGRTSFGAHTLSATVTRTGCNGPLQAKASFVHAAPTKTVTPKFTG